MSLKPTIKIKTKAIVYGSTQKQQKRNYTKIPSGTIGFVKHIETEKEFGLTYYLIKLDYENRVYWAKLNSNLFEIVES